MVIKLENIAYNPEDYLLHDLNDFLYSASFLNSIIVPRPIAFITSRNSKGVINAAPFSYFNIACTNPAIVSIAIERRKGKRKDTANNIALLQEFVINICSIEHADAITKASHDFPPDVSEVEFTKLPLIPSVKISVPRIANMLLHLECKLNQIVELGRDPTDLILGDVINVHLHKSLLNQQGRIDIKKLNPIARLSGATFAQVDHFFDIQKMDHFSRQG